MKYVLVIAALFGPVDGDWTQHTKLNDSYTFGDAAACYAAMDEIEKDLSSRDDFRGAVLECKPATSD